MEDNKELNKFLNEHMLLDHLKIEQPSLLLAEQARKKIIARQKPEQGEIEDFFSLVAAFLNFKIKLYHAAIAMLIIGGCILYFNAEERSDSVKAHSNDLVSNLASAKSTTVLSSINTFALTKEQAYGNRTN